MRASLQQDHSAEFSLLADCRAKNNNELQGQASPAECSLIKNVNKLEDTRLASMNCA